MPDENKNQENNEDIEFLKIEQDGEEIEAVKKEDFEKFQSQYEEAQNELKEIKEKLEKESEKDKNFSNLRKQKEEKETELESVKRQMEEMTEQFNKFKTSSVETLEEKYLKELSSGDEDLEKKIKAEYDNFAGEAKSEEEIKSRMIKAAKLSDVKVDNDVFYQGVGVQGSYQQDTSKKRFTDTDKGKAMLEKLNSKQQTGINYTKANK